MLNDLNLDKRIEDAISEANDYNTEIDFTQGHGLESKTRVKDLIYDARTRCGSCGESRSSDCATCERLWQT